MAPDLTGVIQSQDQQPYPYSTNCGVMQGEKDGMKDTWAGMNLGHWAGLSFAAISSLDLRLVPAEDVRDLVQFLNWMEPHDMKVYSGAGLFDWAVWLKTFVCKLGQSAISLLYRAPLETLNKESGIWQQQLVVHHHSTLFMAAFTSTSSCLVRRRLGCWDWVSLESINLVKTNTGTMTHSGTATMNSLCAQCVWQLMCCTGAIICFQVLLPCSLLYETP